MMLLGITRPLEVLGNHRRNLLLPSDDLGRHSPILLHIPLPKTRGRRARQQHVSVTNDEVAPSLEAI